MSPTLLVLAYGITIVASAVAGGYLPRVVKMNHFRMQLILSFVGGMMLGVAVLHLLLHGFIEIQRAAETVVPNADPVASFRATMIAMLVGLMFTFFLMRAFHFHQHGEELEEGHDHEGPCHHHQDPHSTDRPRLGWVGVIFGLGLHTFMDGVALGAVVAHEYAHGHMHTWAPAGFGVYLAILLHKPLDALSVSTLMAADNRSQTTIHATTAAFGLMAVAGALAVIYLPWLKDGGLSLGYLLAASAGVFLCISLSDLLPEVQFHRHDRLQLSAALILGIAVAFLIEMMHAH